MVMQWTVNPPALPRQVRSLDTPPTLEGVRMKHEIQLSRKSWHYWLAKKSSKWYTPSATLDICSYSRAVIKGALSMLIKTSIIGFVAIFIGFVAIFIGGTLVLCISGFIAWVAACIVSGGFLSPDDPAMISIIFSLGGSGLFLLSKLIDWIFNPFRKTASQMLGLDKSFLSVWYKSWKEKTCFKIKLS